MLSILVPLIICHDVFDDVLLDLGLIESAVAQPQAQYGGDYLHPDISLMTAAYLFHIVSNHPFLDGNKRTGAVTCLVFLEWNCIEHQITNEDLVDIKLKVATSQTSKNNVAEFVRSKMDV